MPALVNMSTPIDNIFSLVYRNGTNWDLNKLMLCAVVKMKVFNLIQKILAIVGIALHQSNQKQSFNTRNLMACLVLISSIILNCVQFFNVASNFTEYADSIYLISMAAVNCSILLTFDWKMETVFECINCFERFIQKSV